MFTGPAPVLMGVINVTPDSFSDGGDYLDPAAAIAHGKKLIAEGATILDIGGESTRPGADPVSVDAEIDRVIPVIEGLKNSGALISVDTRHAQTMRAAVQAGAGMINDVTALAGTDSLNVAAESGACICLMHMQGTPQNMQTAPQYKDVVAEVYGFLETRIAACIAAGVPKDKIIVDPGIGFGKTVAHNLRLLKHLDVFADLGVPMLLGVSRKSFIAAVSRDEPPEDRLPGSLAVALAAADRGVKILRVHDVAATAQALALWRAVAEDKINVLDERKVS